MGNGNAAAFLWMLELMMASFDMDEFPAVLSKAFDNLPTVHGDSMYFA